MMKYFAMLLAFCWSGWMLSANGDLRPSDNLFLWLLGVLTFFYSVLSVIQVIVDITNPNATTVKGIWIVRGTSPGNKTFVGGKSGANPK